MHAIDHQSTYQYPSVDLSPLPASAPDTSVRDDDDRTNYLDEAPILAACRNNNLTWLQELLDSDPSMVNRLYPSGLTGQSVHPLYLAAQEGSSEVVKALLAALIAPLPKYDRAEAIKAAMSAAINTGATPLFIATERGHVEVVKVLIAVLKDALPEHDRAKAIKAAINAASHTGATPLFIAAQNGHTKVVKALIATLKDSLPKHNRADTIKAAVNVACPDGTTPLFMAAQNGHTVVLNCLLEHGADPKKEWIKHPLGKYRIFRPLLTRTPLQAARLNGNKLAANRIKTAIQEKRTNTLVEVSRSIMPSPMVTETTPLLE